MEQIKNCYTGFWGINIHSAAILPLTLCHNLYQRLSTLTNRSQEENLTR